jgi:hypothetical protein
VIRKRLLDDQDYPNHARWVAPVIVFLGLCVLIPFVLRIPKIDAEARRLRDVEKEMAEAPLPAAEQASLEPAAGPPAVVSGTVVGKLFLPDHTETRYVFVPARDWQIVIAAEAGIQTLAVSEGDYKMLRLGDKFTQGQPVKTPVPVSLDDVQR